MGVIFQDVPLFEEMTARENALADGDFWPAIAQPSRSP